MSDQAMSVAAVSAQPRNKVLHIVLWVVQILLGLAFGLAGFMKLTQPIATLGHNMPWTLVVPAALVRFIGASELAGSLGLLLPSLTRILPRLSALAGLGLTVVMILAMGFHISRGEMYGIPPTLILGLLAAFVAWGRFRKAPIEPR
jgi:uncharacterized membrane protein YphA (DoxX/SURF4 family)